MAKKREPKQQISFRVEAAVREAIEREAERERRPVANLIGTIVRDWFEARARQQAA